MALEYVLPSLHCVQAQPANTPATNKETWQVTSGKQINHQHLLQEVPCLIIQPTHQHLHLYTCPRTLLPQPIHPQSLPCVHLTFHLLSLYGASPLSEEKRSFLRVYCFYTLCNILFLAPNPVIKVYFRNNVILLLLLTEFLNISAYSDNRELSKERNTHPKYRSRTTSFKPILNNEPQTLPTGKSVGRRVVLPKCDLQTQRGRPQTLGPAHGMVRESGAFRKLGSNLSFPGTQGQNHFSPFLCCKTKQTLESKKWYK